MYFKCEIIIYNTIKSEIDVPTPNKQLGELEEIKPTRVVYKMIYLTKKRGVGKCKYYTGIDLAHAINSKKSITNHHAQFQNNGQIIC